MGSAPSESHSRAYDVNCGIELSPQFVPLGVCEIDPRVLHKQMRVTNIEIHEMSGRPPYPGGKKIAVIVRDTRRAELRASDGSFVVCKSEAKLKFFGPIQFNPRE